MKTFTIADFDALGVCKSGLGRVVAFGGAIENSPAGWQAYIDANPDAWRAPLFTAWLLHVRRVIHCPDLIWRVARIAFREQPEANAQLRVYGETLGPDTWREARSAAASVAEDAAAAAAASVAADAYAVYSAANAVADVRPAFKAAIKAEIIAMAVEVLQAVPA